MNWVTGIQNAVDYIEAHLTENIDYDIVAAQSFSSAYHFQRVFSILCGFTIGEYIRNRRLSLAGAELATGNVKVIDIALKYGYENPDSFAKAFQRFHGVLPSQARNSSCNLKSFSRLCFKISLEGGNDMNYRIEEKPEMILTGYRNHFTGIPYGEEREKQEEKLFISTRGKQWFLRGVANDADAYCVTTNFTEEGYDFLYCHLLDNWCRENLFNKDVTGVDFVEELELENIVIPRRTYVIFETHDKNNAINDYMKLLDMRIHILTEWLPEMGFQLADGSELVVYHWIPKDERNVQIWLPVEKSKM